jgi:hypothetical protein
MSEDKVVSLGTLVTGEARLVLCLISRFAILVELRETPAVGRGVPF